MDVPFSTTTEAQIRQLAARKGKDAAQVVEGTMARVMERRAQFLDGVKRGITAADGGDLLDDDEARSFLEQRERSPFVSAGRA